MQNKMMIPLPAIAILLLVGVCSTVCCTELPTQIVVYWLLAAAALSIAIPGTKYMRSMGFLLLGFALMCWHINTHCARALPAERENVPLTIVGTIVSVIEENSDHKARFVFRLIDNRNLVQLNWDNPQVDLRPGDVWRLSVKLKRPRNYANPGSFDSERFYFHRRIIATGVVRTKEQPQLLARKPWLYPIQNLRQELLAMLGHELSGKEFGGIIIATVLGIKSHIPAAQIQLLQNTGTAHLMAISGLHIGLIAGMVFAILRFAWCYTPPSWLRLAAPWVAAWGALGVSVFYALIAGFGVATQRALIMVLASIVGLLMKRKISSVNSYSLAMIVVLICDPFVVLAVGFWLSFVAVGLLIFAMHGRKYQRHSWWSISKLIRPQLVISLGLLPISLIIFAQTSIAAPIANLSAIPWVSLAVIPFSLAAVLIWPIDHFIAVKSLHFAEYNFALLWKILSKFEQIPNFAWHPPAEYLAIIFVCAMLGTLWMLLPRGIPGRWWGIVAFFPLLFTPVNAVDHGQAEFTLLDVGQGLAAVVRTQHHVLVYDTGAKINPDFDLGARVVGPFLQTKGIRQIDMLMISHADNDHIGGAESILSKFFTAQLLISDINYLSIHKPQECQAGQSWHWDGVDFFVLHPVAQRYYKRRNDRSCVLLVRAGEHNLLLTGDIESKAEQQLIASYGEHLQADILLVPHHGSKTSSSLEFIQTVQPQYALIPAGYKNQYGHPKPEILQRYVDQNIVVLRTDQHGALSFILGQKNGLQAKLFRRDNLRFWNI